MEGEEEGEEMEEREEDEGERRRGLRESEHEGAMITQRPCFFRLDFYLYHRRRFSLQLLRVKPDNFLSIHSAQRHCRR